MYNLYEMSKNLTYKQISEITGIKVPTITKKKYKKKGD